MSRLRDLEAPLDKCSTDGSSMATLGWDMSIRPDGDSLPQQHSPCLSSSEYSFYEDDEALEIVRLAPALISHHDEEDLEPVKIRRPTTGRDLRNDFVHGGGGGSPLKITPQTGLDPPPLKHKSSFVDPVRSSSTDVRDIADLIQDFGSFDLGFGSTIDTLDYLGTSRVPSFSDEPREAVEAPDPVDFKAGATRSGEESSRARVSPAEGSVQTAQTSFDWTTHGFQLERVERVLFRKIKPGLQVAVVTPKSRVESSHQVSVDDVGRAQMMGDLAGREGRASGGPSPECSPPDVTPARSKIFDHDEDDEEKEGGEDNFLTRHGGDYRVRPIVSHDGWQDGGEDGVLQRAARVRLSSATSEEIVALRDGSGLPLESCVQDKSLLMARPKCFAISRVRTAARVV